MGGGAWEILQENISQKGRISWWHSISNPGKTKALAQTGKLEQKW